VNRVLSDLNRSIERASAAQKSADAGDAGDAASMVNGFRDADAFLSRANQAAAVYGFKDCGKGSPALSANDQNRNLREVQDLVGHAPHHQSGEVGQAPRPHHDQIDVLVLRSREDLSGRLAVVRVHHLAPR
jgi:hypothetical protein